VYYLQHTVKLFIFHFSWPLIFIFYNIKVQSSSLDHFFLGFFASTVVPFHQTSKTARENIIQMSRARVQLQPTIITIMVTIFKLD